MKVLTAAAFLVAGALSSHAHAGELKFFKNSLSKCTSQDQSAGRCTGGDDSYEACITYINPGWKNQVCDLRGSAKMKENETGFSKYVFDHRQEILYPQQVQRFCFAFEKDIYNLWKLVKIDEPSVSCVDKDEGKVPSCNKQDQSGCKAPVPDDSASECDPFTGWASCE